jgi:hypothetical protein
VYGGRERAGSVERDGAFLAYDSSERLIGTFVARRPCLAGNSESAAMSAHSRKANRPSASAAEPVFEQG